MKAIFKRELRSYFTGGIGCVYCAVFALIMNFLYRVFCLNEYSSDFTVLFPYMLVAMILLIPIMTMRIWSEEKKQKTDQLLLTAPVSTTEIVLGKFFAAMCVFLLSLALTLAYPIIAAARGTLQGGIVFGNYIAIILAGAAYIAISQFMSSLTESQIISALLSMLTLSSFFFLNMIFSTTTIDVIAKVAAFLSIITRFINFTKGIFSLSDVVYFVSLAALFLFFTSRVVEKRRWS